MPSTDIRDKAEEQHQEKRVPLPLAILVIVLVLAGILLAGYFSFQLFY